MAAEDTISIGSGDRGSGADRMGMEVHVVTNDDLQYILESLEEKKLKPAGIVAAEMVRACKPHREIFEKALRKRKT